MRRALSFARTAVLVAVVSVSVPAMAGTFNFVNGTVVWQSTDCPQPPLPVGLNPNGPEPAADSLNARSALYNAYVQQMQVYMNCVSSEGQRDANRAGEMIIRSAQSVIGVAEENVNQVSRMVHR